VLTHVSEDVLDDIATGAAILGTGGGGSPYVGKLMAREAIRAAGPVEVVQVEDVGDAEQAITTAIMGAPSVFAEKLPEGLEVDRAFRAVLAYLRREVEYTMPIEAGGLNSVIPLCLAARSRLPVVDADCMGRAFPEAQMVLPTLYGIPASPMGVADEKGNVALYDTTTNLWAERLARSTTVHMGCIAGIALYCLNGTDLRRATIPRTLTLAADLGRLVREVHGEHGAVIDAVAGRLDGRRLFAGKVVGVDRRIDAGWTRADFRLDGVGPDSGTALTLHAQNEFLAARGPGGVLASTPDLVIVLDLDSGLPITTEELRYGYRVSVLAAPCDPRWRSEAGLALAGPRCFGYDFDFVPFEDVTPAIGRGTRAAEEDAYRDRRDPLPAPRRCG
jgi:DUF917 family protein